MRNPIQAIYNPSVHFMKNRSLEIMFGVLFFAIGALLLYDAFDARGKKMPWPAGAVTPW